MAGQQVTENLLGPFLDGELMRVASIGVCVGLMFGAQSLGLTGLEGFTALQVAIMGVAAGLGSNQLHGVLERFAPASLKAPLAGILTRLANRPTPPPAPPTG